jgi:hypothetical protein
VLVVTVAAVSTLSGSGLAGIDGLVDSVVNNVVGGGGRGLRHKSGGLTDALVVAPIAVGSRGRGGRGRGSLGGSWGRASLVATSTSTSAPGNGVSLACGSDGGRSLGGELIVVTLAGAKGDHDVGIVRAGLHAIGIIVGVTVGLLLGRAVVGVGGDLPVAGTN